MKTAILTGATGLVGMFTANYLTRHGVKVLALGRKKIDSHKSLEFFGPDFTYQPLDMNELELLPSIIQSLNWDVSNDCVFYHFAWSGIEKLTDGGLEMQLNNAINTATAVKTAKKVGCRKFISVGTIEETFAEIWLTKCEDNTFNSNQSNYIIAKLTSRDMGKITAYLEKIDYIHTRLSVPLDFSLSHGTYIATTLKKIKNMESWELPTSDAYYDITDVKEIAKAYYLLGQSLTNNRDFYIGAAEPIRLRDLFNFFEQLSLNSKIIVTDDVKQNTKDFFCTRALFDDIGFSPRKNYRDLVEAKFTN